jgi:uncharacterized NAD(P)/FAD-binding protein YdhS
MSKKNIEGADILEKRNTNWVLNYLITSRRGKLFLQEPSLQRSSKNYLDLKSVTETSQTKVINNLYDTLEELKHNQQPLTHQEIAQTFQDNLNKI